MSLDPSRRADPHPNDNGLADVRAAPLVSEFRHQAVTAYCATLHDTSAPEHTRRFAARRLGEGGKDLAITQLAESLIKDPSAIVRSECAAALGRIKGHQAIHALMQALGDRSQFWLPDGVTLGKSVAEVAATSLAAMSPIPPEYHSSILYEAQRSPTSVASWLYLTAAKSGGLTQKAIKSARSDAVLTTEEQDRARLMEALEISLGPASATYFVSILKGWLSSARAREQAAQCLGYLREESNREAAYPALIEYAQAGGRNPKMPDYDSFERGIPGLEAIAALLRFQTPRAQEGLITLLGAKNLSVDFQAASAIAEMHSRGVKAERPLFEALDDNSITPARAASIAQALGFLQSSLVVPKLLGALQGLTAVRNAPEFYRRCAEALGRHAKFITSREVDVLCELALGKDEEVRIAAVEAIGQIPGSESRALKALLQNLEEEVPYRVTLAACNSLVKLSCVQAIPQLEEVARDPWRSSFVITAAKRAVADLRKFIPGQSEE